jgi:hypothetical protein
MLKKGRLCFASFAINLLGLLCDLLVSRHLFWFAEATSGGLLLSCQGWLLFHWWRLDIEYFVSHYPKHTFLWLEHEYGFAHISKSFC